ncbi:hypothetical protein C7B76_30005 [filamentous cyanobacterium CCP2]|nr:hypothetical protein C7B76_30005 [filamentous cyanobacterium CCP2]
MAEPLKEIQIWRKRLLADLKRRHQETREDPDNLAQDMVSYLLLLALCHEHGVQPHQHLAGIVQPNLGLENDSLQQMIRCFKPFREEETEIPIERLGQVYEQFLATERSSQKSGGAYYTPRPVVDYILTHTLGKQLLKASQKAAQPASQGLCGSLRILDPACGSGAFLLAAYQFLLNWYKMQYVAELDRYGLQLYKGNGGWRLTFEARRDILLEHIHGVDIDPQAVEITKRSLLLQLLAGISEEEQARQVRSNFPVDSSVLDRNIYCGNALIDSDFYQGLDKKQLFDPDINSIKGLNWEKAFPEVMRSGGFNVVIGNPPWVFTRDVQFGDRVKKYYQLKYLNGIQTTQKGKAKQTGKINLFILFLIRMVQLTHQEGLAGIVLPNTFFRTTIYDVARKYILEHCNIQQIVDLGCETFPGVTASTAILILGKNLADMRVQCLNGIQQAEPRWLDKKTFLTNASHVFSIFMDEPQQSLFQHMENCSIHLETLVKDIIEGIVCQRDQVIANADRHHYKKLLEGKDITRYCITFRNKYVLFDRQQLHRPRPEYVWAANEKIILRRIGGGAFPLIAALDTANYCTFASVNNLLIQENCSYNIRYLLALLNSTLLNYYYSQKFTNRSRLTVNISKTFVQQLPIRAIDFNNPLETQKHDRLVQAVNMIEALQTQSLLTQDVNQRQPIIQEIAKIDRQIDQWVYELYGLTAADTHLIQENFSENCN